MKFVSEDIADQPRVVSGQTEHAWRSLVCIVCSKSFSVSPVSSVS